MILNKWKLEAIVRKNPGISLNDFATAVGVNRRTAHRHARRHAHIVVEESRGGKGVKTKLWLSWDLPDHLIVEPSVRDTVHSNRSLRVYTLDEL
jgi:hypothetical protein